jgi:hypothetical protein
MAYGVVLRFDGVGEDQYWAVNQELGIERDGSGDWPDGLLSHAAGPVGTGWLVSEVWESRSAQEAFMASRLSAALGSVGLPPPSEVVDSELVNHHSHS